MARYPMDYEERTWYGGGMRDGDSDAGYGFSARGFGRGNFGGRSLPRGRGAGERGYGRQFQQAGGGYYGHENAGRRFLRGSGQTFGGYAGGGMSREAFSDDWRFGGYGEMDRAGYGGQRAYRNPSRRYAETYDRMGRSRGRRSRYGL